MRWVILVLLLAGCKESATGPHAIIIEVDRFEVAPDSTCVAWLFDAHGTACADWRHQ